MLTPGALSSICTCARAPASPIPRTATYRPPQGPENRQTRRQNPWMRGSLPASTPGHGPPSRILAEGPRTPGHIPGIATPIHLPSTADTPSMYFSYTAQRRDPQRAGTPAGLGRGRLTATGDRASRAWPTARRPSASVSLCRAADGPADPSTLLPLRLAESFSPGLLLAGVCVVHRGQVPQHDRGLGPAVGERAGLRAVPVGQRTFLLSSFFRVAPGEPPTVIQPCSEVPFDPFALQLSKQLSYRTIRPAQPRPGLALPPGADRPAGPAAGRPDRRAYDAA
jgi:hypothetical protein